MSSKSLFRWIFSSHTPSEEPSAMPNPVENLLPDSPSQPELDHAPPTPSPPDLDGSSGDQLHFELGRLDVREPDASQSEAEKGFGGESGGVRLIDESGEPEPEPEPERQRDGAQQVEEEEEEEEQSGGEKNNGDFGQCEEDEKKDERTRMSNYPVRPEAEDCSFYLKTGTCKFASNCKFNHPVQRKNQAAKDKLKEKEEAKERTGQMECKFYLKMGGCKYGKDCRYSHTRPKAPVAPFVELNFLGLPIRPGEKECPFYMRNGSCKYAANCRYNHPDPTAGGGEPHSEYSNGGSASLQSASQFAGASWSSPGALNESASFVPMMYSPTHGMSSPNAEWNGYQFHVNPPGQVMRPPLPYVMKNPVTEGHMYPPHQQQMFVDEFPERPGQPDCSYFLKTGECKFKANCKYHHPKDRISKSPAVVLSDKGLPLRPDQNICSYYSRYGICKFGPACKFDHPIHLASSTMSGLDHHQPSSAANSASIDGPIMDGSWDSNDATVQQSV